MFNFFASFTDTYDPTDYQIRSTTDKGIANRAR
jgi:hypothetical protein